MKKLSEPLKENIKKNLNFYAISCIPIFPLSLAVNILLYLYAEYELDIGGISNCILLISGVLLLSCFAIFRYSLKAYIRQKSEKYSLLLILGISRKDFWRILAKDYCPAFLLLIIIFAVSSTAISNVVLIATFRNISSDIISISVKLMICFIMLFFLGMAGTMMIFAADKWESG